MELIHRVYCYLIALQIAVSSDTVNIYRYYLYTNKFTYTYATQPYLNNPKVSFKTMFLAWFMVCFNL